MTNTAYNTDPYAAHAALLERIEAASLHLERLEKRRQLGAYKGWSADYRRANADLEDLFDERAELEEEILASPISDYWEIEYRGTFIAHAGETYPQRAADLLRRMADQAEKWAAGIPMIWFKSAGLKPGIAV